MLMVVSESAGKTQTLVEVARELSLSLRYFRNVAKLVSLLAGRSRRFVMLVERT
jgi:hypothetical protein